jgi:hypothetical protein
MAGDRRATKRGMAGTVEPDKAAERHPYGPRPIAALLPALTRTAFRRRSPAAAHLLADWEAIVGPAIAAVTVPERCSAGLLSIACAGPVALELQHLAPKLIERINIHVGRTLVTRLRFRQAPLPAAARGAAPTVGAPRAGGGRTDAALAARLVGVPEGALKDALTRLGQAIDGEEAKI